MACTRTRDVFRCERGRDGVGGFGGSERRCQGAERRWLIQTDFTSITSLDVKLGDWPSRYTGRSGTDQENNKDV